MVNSFRKKAKIYLERKYFNSEQYTVLNLQTSYCTNRFNERRATFHAVTQDVQGQRKDFHRLVSAKLQLEAKERTATIDAI